MRECIALDLGVIPILGAPGPGETMAKCDAFHREFDRFANGALETGVLPAGMHVRGKVAWSVYQGPYEGLGPAMQRFIGQVMGAHHGPVVGPMGDVYPCDPREHTGADAARLSTVFWMALEP